MNPRTPTGQNLKSCTFDQTLQPSHCIGFMHFYYIDLSNVYDIKWTNMSWKGLIWAIHPKIDWFTFVDFIDHFIKHKCSHFQLSNNQIFAISDIFPLNSERIYVNFSLGTYSKLYTLKTFEKTCKSEIPPEWKAVWYVDDVS